MHRSRSRFSNVYAGYHCACSMHRWNSCDYRTPLWSTRKCGRRPFGCAGCPNTCSMSHNSCCAKRSRSPLLRNSGSNFHADAAMQNTVPTSHSYNCDRWNRWFRSWSARRHSYNYGIHCWCKLRPADSVIPMCDCRIPGKCPNHTRRSRGSWLCKFLNIGYDGRYCIHCSLHGLARNGRLQRKYLGTNTFRTTGSCR